MKRTPPLLHPIALMVGLVALLFVSGCDLLPESLSKPDPPSVKHTTVNEATVIDDLGMDIKPVNNSDVLENVTEVTEDTAALILTTPPAPISDIEPGAADDAPIEPFVDVTTDPDEVAYHLWVTGYLPMNYLTKDQAYKKGWNPEKGNLRDVAGKDAAIGGDRFGNREGLLPNAEGREWFECDVNYEGGTRGAERIVWSSDMLIYYTDDHYESFTQIFDPAKDEAPRSVQ